MSAPSWNDNTVQYGSRIWFVSNHGSPNTAFDTYVADNITVNRPTNIVRRTDQIGEPSGSVGINGFVEGNCTLQLSSGSTKEPTPGLDIACTGGAIANVSNVVLDSTIGTETFVISSVSRAEVKDAEKKFHVNFIKRYG